MRAEAYAVVLLLAVLGTGCQRGDSTLGDERQPIESRSTEPGAAGAGVLSAQPAGGGEDICAEHGVLEAVCTKCNPKLIPVFQAKGDWCAEHGLPESFCPICHPERGGRPATDVTADAADGAPPDRLRVNLRSPEVVAEAGIRTVEAVAAAEATTIVATALIVADNARSALVNARLPGVIRAFVADVGSVVTKGTPLAAIESAAVAEARARLRTAEAEVGVAEAAYNRERELNEQGISPLKDVQVAEQELSAARAEVGAALAVLEMVGTGDGESGSYELKAPIAGVVTQRNFTVGTLVGEDEPIFEIIDTSSLWAEIDIPESQAGSVAPGQRVVLQVDALGDREFEGVIRYVAPVIDTRTRTIRARAALTNADRVLRANMYARAHIAVDTAASSVLVPRAALQQAKGVHLVFVPVSDHEYEMRRVRTEPSDGELIPVVAGLRAGELVVTDGSFLLKTETLKESIGAGCCDDVDAR